MNYCYLCTFFLHVENNKAEAREKGRKNTSERETDTVMDEVRKIGKRVRKEDL